MSLDELDLEIIDDDEYEDDDDFIDRLEAYFSSKSWAESESLSAFPPENAPSSPWLIFTDPKEVSNTAARSLDFHKSFERFYIPLPIKTDRVIQTPRYYAQHITIALNSHDYNYLYYSIYRLSTNRLEIRKHVYSYDVTGKGLEERVFGSVEEFCQFMEVWNMFLPDGVFETSSHRQCICNSSTSIFISTLYFSGQKVVKGVDVMNEDLCLYYPRLHEMMVNTIDGRKYPDIVELSGSLVIYVNGFGLIDKLEIFCCQMEQ